MGQMREAAPQRIKLVESNPAPKKTKFETCINYAKKTGRASLLPLVFAGAITACGGGTERVNTPTKEAHTPGVNVVHATETPIPAQTATVADFLTSTAKAEATKTEQPTQTPETTTTPEKENLHQGYQIELDDKVKALQAEGKALPSDLTVEQYQAKIQEELNKFPKIGNLVVKLYFPTQEAIDSGTANDYFLVQNGDRKILLRADRRGDFEATLSLAELDHELGGHFFSISSNGEYWQNILTPSEYEQARQIEDAASHNPEYGLADDQDAFVEYFSDKMEGGTEYPTSDLGIDAQKASSRKRMLEIMLSGLNSPADKTPNPFLTLIEDQLNEIHTYANSPEMLQKAEYSKDAVTTLDRNQAMVDKISAESPLMAQVYKSIRENGAVLTEHNMARTSSASDTFKMTGFTKGEAFENLSLAGAKIFLEREYLAGNLIVVEAFKDQNAEIKQFRINKEIKARKEGPPDQIKVHMRVPGSNPPGAKLLTLFDNVAQRLSR